MPTIIRRSDTVTVSDKRREVIRAVAWQVSASVWSPPTDMYETEAEYVVRMEVAGAREAEFEVMFDEGVLIITGNRPDIPERRAYHQMEIHFGKFSSAIAIPGPVDLDGSGALYQEGFLIVRLPKAKPHDVKIEE